MSYILYADNQVIATVDSDCTGFVHDPDAPLDYIFGQYGYINDNRHRYKSAKAYSCPNCGAPVKSHTCEYCGTILDPIAAKNEKYNQEWSLQREKSELIFLESRMRALQAQISQEEQNRSIISHLSNTIMKG